MLPLWWSVAFTGHCRVSVQLEMIPNFRLGPFALILFSILQNTLHPAPKVALCGTKVRFSEM